MKILGDIAWFKGEFVYLSYILASGEVRDYKVLSLSTRGRLLGITLELLKTKHVKDEGLKKTKDETSMKEKDYSISFYYLAYILCKPNPLVYKEDTCHLFYVCQDVENQ